MFKKVLRKTVLVTAMVFIVLLAGTAFASDVSVYVDGNKVSFPDQQPFIDDNNRTLVPLRFVAEEMGASVEWLASDGVVLIDKSEEEPQSLLDKAKSLLDFQNLVKEVKNFINRTLISLKIGENRAQVNGEWKTFDTKPVLINGRTMVPLRFISETLGARVEWDDATRTVYIYTSGSTGPVEPEYEYEVINGFKVPKETDMIIDGQNLVSNVEIAFLIGVHKPMQVQLNQTKAALESKFGQHASIDQAIAYAGQKTQDAQFLETQYFNINGHRIDVGSSRGNFRINILVRKQ